MNREADTNEEYKRESEKVKEKVKRPLTRIGFDWLGT